MTTTVKMSSYCYRLYAGNGNWVSLGTKTTQDLLDIFEKGVSCRYPLTDQLFIDIIPHDVDCNSKNIDMLGLMRADLVYEPLESEPEVQQSMSHYVHSLLNEQGIIDAFPPLRSDGNLPSIDSLPTHRHLSLVPSTVNSAKRRVRQSEGVKPGSTSFNSSASESPTLEPIQPLPPLAAATSSFISSSSSFVFNVPSTSRIQRKEHIKSSNSSSTSGSSSVSSQKNHSNKKKPYQTRSSNNNMKKKYPEMSSSNLETEQQQHHHHHHHDNDSTLYDRMENQVDNLEWLNPSAPSLWIPNDTSYPLREEEEEDPFYHHQHHHHHPPVPEAKLEHDPHPISPADIMHHYHHLASSSATAAAAAAKGSMINMTPGTGSAFDMMGRNDSLQQQEYNSDHSMENIMSPVPTSTWSSHTDKKQMICLESWKERQTKESSVNAMHCLEYEKYTSPFNAEREDLKSRTANILSHQ